MPIGARTIRWLALWTIGLWAAFVPGLGLALVAPAPTLPLAVQGVLDLRQWDLARDGAVRLDGEWSFFWDQSRQSLTETSPRETVKVPGNWLQNGHPTKGKAVYRLRILT